MTKPLERTISIIPGVLLGIGNVYRIRPTSISGVHGRLYLQLLPEGLDHSTGSPGQLQLNAGYLVISQIWRGGVVLYHDYDAP